MVAGRNSVLEALREDVPATALYVASRIDSDDRVKEAISLAAGRGISMLEASRADLDRLTDDAIHQGIALQIPPYEYADPRDLLEFAAERAETPLIVALDGVTDPRNLGAIVRSVAAFGGHGVIIPERRAASMTAAAWKTSAGAASRIKVAQVVNLARAIDELKKQGVFVVGLDMDGEVDLPELTFSRDPLCIVVGSEGKGGSPASSPTSATRSSRSRSPRPPSRSTPASPPPSASTRSPAPAATERSQPPSGR